MKVLFHKVVFRLAFFLLLAVFSLPALVLPVGAEVVCTASMNGKTIGSELVSTTCSTSSSTTRTFIHTVIECQGGQVSKFADYGDQTTTPGALVYSYTNSGYRVFGDSVGDRIVAIHSNFGSSSSDTIDGHQISDYATGSFHSDVFGKILYPESVDLDADNDHYTECEDCDDTNPNYHDNCPTGDPKLEDPATCAGKVPVGSTAGADTGEYFHGQDLFSLSGPPLSASIRLSYRSFGRVGTLGQGWRHSYDIALRDDGTGNLVVRMGSKERLYTLSGSTYVPEVDDYGTLVDNGDGTHTLTEKSGMVYTFNSSGKCTTITDRNGNQNVLAYNTDGLLETVTDSAGRVSTFVYNTDTTLASVTDPKSNGFTFGYTSSLLTSVTHPDGSNWGYTYDGDGYLETKTDPEVYTVTNTLDTSHRITESKDPYNRTRVLEYPTDTTPTVLSTTFTEKDGNDWIYTYDTAAKVLLSKTDPEGFTTSYTWDSNKNMLSKTEPGNVVTSYTYDGDGNVLTVTDALSRVTTFTYNSFGQILTAVGPRGTIENTYDADGNLLQVENVDDTVTLFTYNTKGQVTKITDALTRETDFVYDTNGLLTSVTPPSGVTQSFTYDANGNMLTMTAGGLTTTYTYDSMNRVATITDPLSNLTTYTYDGNGNIATVTDAENRVTSYDHNYQDQPTLIQDALNGLTTMEYGASGCASCGGGADKLTSLTDPADKTTSFEYGTTGHLVREIDPLGNMTQYFYEDGRGNLTKRIDANNQTILYTYDNLNRLTQVDLPDSQTVTYTYNPTTGDLTNVTGPDIGYTFTYDTLGRITGVTDTRGYSLAYTYNDLGQRTQVTLPGSQTIAYAYDTGNRLSTLTSEAGVFTFGYDTKDRRSSLAFPNGITAAYGFDNADRLTSLIHSATSGDVLNIAYPQLDNLGNRIQRTEDGQTTTYGYDELYRLLNATDTNGTETFTYDSVGNRLSGPTVKDTPANAYDYNDTHQMIQGRKFDYTYDNNGNQIVRSQKNGKGWIQEWDAQNRLIKVERTNGADSRTVTFKYDPFGRRIEKKAVDVFSGVTATTTTAYVYDAEDIVLQVETIDTGGTPTVTETRFIHGPGIDEPLAMVRGGQNYFYHADGLGSIVAITNQSQAIVQKYSYETFGLPTPTDPSFRQPYAFTAREWDRETGLYFYRARYYDPMEGRFISKDPLGFAGGSVNVYGYVQNNSINFVDPWGLRIQVMGSPDHQEYILDQLRKFVRGVLSVDKNGMLSRTPCKSDEDIESLVDELIKSDKLYRIFDHLYSGSWGRSSTIPTSLGADIYFDPNIDANYFTGPFSQATITPAAELSHELLGRGTQIERGEPYGPMGTHIRDQFNRNAMQRANPAYIRMGMDPRFKYK